MFLYRFLLIVLIQSLFLFSKLSKGSYVITKCRVSELLNVTSVEKSAVERTTFSLTLSEKILFMRKIRSATVILEYGDGDTIPLYCRASLKTIIVISADPSIQQVDASVCSKNHIHFLPYYITLGEIGKYNSYITNASMDLWPNYVKSLELFQSFQPNFYFINGKLRFAILLHLLLQLLNDLNGRKSIQEIELQLSRVTVMVHDFYGLHYHPPQMFFLYYDFIDCIDSLVVLKPKLRLNKQEIEDDFKKYIKVYV